METIFQFCNYKKIAWVPTGEIVRKKDGTVTEKRAPVPMQSGWIRIRPDCEFRWFVTGGVNKDGKDSRRYFLKRIVRQNQWRNRAIEVVAVEKGIKVASFADMAKAIKTEGCPLSETTLANLIETPKEVEQLPVFAPWHKPTKMDIVRLREKAMKAEESARKAERVKKFNESQEKAFLASL